MHAHETQKALEEVGSDGLATGLEVELLEPNDASIKAPFDPAKIDVVTQARTVDLMLKRLREGEIDLSPEFQRRGNLWNDRRKSGLIESMLLRIPIPSLYVSEDKSGNYTVVDGLQRMCAIAHFVDVKALNAAVGSALKPLELSGLQSLPSDFTDQKYEDLLRPLKRRIDETELTLHVIRASTPDEVKFNIFSRINQGGLPLTPQEIRNAIYRGPWQKRIKLMAEDDAFRRATEFKIRGERMEDIELVLRFAAHSALEPGARRPDNQNLDDFLNMFVRNEGVNWSQSDWDRLSKEFAKAMRASSQVFGRYAFRKYYGSGYRSPINRGLFESQAVVLSRMTDDEIAVLSDKSAVVLEKLAGLFINDREFLSALLYATGRGSSSNARLDALEGILNETLNA